MCIARPLQNLILMFVLVLASCVTVNIYFPAAEVQQAADKIVHEVWGTPGGTVKDIEVPAQKPSEHSWLQKFNPFLVATAHAEQDIRVSTPEIRAIKQSIKNRSAQLKPYLNSGAVGITADGFLTIRDQKSVALNERSSLKRSIQQENADRNALYKAIATANGFPGKVDEVQRIFAGSWKQQAERGWYVQSGNGSWSRK